MPVAFDADATDVAVELPDLVNIYGGVVGAGTSIGPFVEIQAGSSIGARCVIASMSFICAGVTIGDDVTIGHGVMFTNDLRPRSVTAAGELMQGGDWTLTPTRVEAGAWIGSNATIVCGVTIGRGAIVHCGSVVTRDVAAHAVVEGVRARPVNLRQHIRDFPRTSPPRTLAAIWQRS